MTLTASTTANSPQKRKDSNRGACYFSHAPRPRHVLRATRSFSLLSQAPGPFLPARGCTFCRMWLQGHLPCPHLARRRRQQPMNHTVGNSWASRRGSARGFCLRFIRYKAVMWPPETRGAVRPRKQGRQGSEQLAVSVPLTAPLTSLHLQVTSVPGTTFPCASGECHAPAATV